MPRVRRLTSALLNLVTVAWVAVTAALTLLQVVNLETSITVVLFETFTMYAFLPGYLLVPLVVWQRRRTLAVAGMALLLIQISWVVPALLSSHAATAEQRAHSIRIFDQNVQGAINPTPDQVGAAIRASDADIVTLQEVAEPFIKRLDAMGATNDYPYRLAEADQLVLSKFRLGASQRVGTGTYYFVERTPVVVRGMTFTLYSVHMPAPLYEDDFAHDAAHADTTFWDQAYRDLDADMSALSGPLIAVGDFNATLSHHGLRNLIKNGVVEASVELGHSFDRTWPVRGVFAPFGALIRIDHVLLRGITPIAIGEGDGSGSDHRSVTVDLGLPA